MVHVNDDTNDELFRKAAEDYFLGTNPDWEKLLHKIDTNDLSPANETFEPNKEKFHLLLYLVNSSRSIMRVFRLRSRAGKNKKKINACISNWQTFPSSFRSAKYGLTIFRNGIANLFPATGRICIIAVFSGFLLHKTITCYLKSF